MLIIRYLLSFCAVWALLLPGFASTRIISAAQVDNVDFGKLQDNKFESALNSIVLEHGQLQARKLQHYDDLNQDYLRVVHWNIERGFNIDAMRSLFTNAHDYMRDYINAEIYPENSDNNARLEEEAHYISRADILLLNEVDLGVHRTGYRNIAAELAAALNADYAFAPEFVELDPAIINDPKLDHSRYKGLHGNAIVSRYPIVKTELIRLPDCYDWYEGELRTLSLLELGRRGAAKAVVAEDIITEVRRGGRLALVALIALPNQEQITVISTHLENRCQAKCREKQLEFILEVISQVPGPLVLAGDLNNFEGDAGPTSITRLVSSKITDIDFLARTALTFINPYSLITNSSSIGLGTLRKYKDPTVRSIPILLPNKAYSLFRDLKKFEFDDDEHFDHSGSKGWNYGAKSGKWSNSNQRAAKGFADTFQLKRSFGVAKFKIDWIFVKAVTHDGVKKYFPAFGRTLGDLNNSYRNGAEKLSDHNPISVDIMI